MIVTVLFGRVDPKVWGKCPRPSCVDGKAPPYYKATTIETCDFCQGTGKDRGDGGGYAYEAPNDTRVGDIVLLPRSEFYDEKEGTVVSLTSNYDGGVRSIKRIVERKKPRKNDRYVWTPGNNLGRVFMTVKTVLINGANPRVTFNCTTGRDQWRKTMKFPLIHTIQEHEWTEEDVREARRSDGAHPEGLAVQPTTVHLHGLPPTAVESRP